MSTSTPSRVYRVAVEDRRIAPGRVHWAV